jgi:sugar lactone lactonase YvrE
MVSRVDVAIHAGALLGEGPRWNADTQQLLWVDIEGRAVHVSDPATGEDRTIPVGSRAGVASWTTRADAVLVALADRLALLDLGDESLLTLAEIPHGGHMRTNDGACDSAGRFWVGSMALDETPRLAALYRFADGVLDRVLDHVSLSNGIAWSPDGTLMYYVDSPSHQVDVFDYDVASGTLASRRRFVRIDPDGTPDGLLVDDQGGVWVAIWDGRAVRRYDASGRLDQVVDVPAEHVTACCFGGPDRRSLYITTAAPEGNVFVTDAGVSGPPAHRFRLAEGRSSLSPEDDPASAR